MPGATTRGWSLEILQEFVKEGERSEGDNLQRGSPVTLPTFISPQGCVHVIALAATERPAALQLLREQESLDRLQNVRVAVL